MAMTPHNMRMLQLNQAAYTQAYGEIRDRFELRAKQRDQLDESPLYVAIMEAGRIQAWDLVRGLLTQARIIDDTPADPLTGARITLERRDPSDPNCYPCCGGLRISRTHTSRCRYA